MVDVAIRFNDTGTRARKDGESRPAGHAVKSGFLPRSRAFHRAYNFVLGLVLFLVALPLLTLISVLLLLTQGRRVFYFGERIGRDGRTFHVIKFRTLDDAKAKALTRDRVLPSGSGIETPLGLFLRETRLDELPQLLNVIRGDMNICGPRPVRPEIAAVERTRIRNYDARFRVKPGLIGHTQAYMGHGVSKAVRARYNGPLCRAPVRYSAELGLVFTVGCCVVARTISRAWRGIGRRIFGSGFDDRATKRARGLQVRLVLDRRTALRVVRIDRHTMIFAGLQPRWTTLRGRLVLTLPNGQQRYADVTVAPHAVGDDGGHTAWRYAIATEFGQHVVSRYLLEKVVVPHRSTFVFARIYHGVRRMISGSAASVRDWGRLSGRADANDLVFVGGPELRDLGTVSPPRATRKRAEGSRAAGSRAA